MEPVREYPDLLAPSEPVDEQRKVIDMMTWRLAHRTDDAKTYQALEFCMEVSKRPTSSH